MKKILILTLVAIVLVAGCIDLGGDTVETSTGKGVEIIDFAPNQPDVYAGRSTRILMSIENQGGYNVPKEASLVLLTGGTDWEPVSGQSYAQELKADLNAADPQREKPAGKQLYSWSLTAPPLPSGQSRSDRFTGRIYYDYQTRANGHIWIYPEAEAMAMRDKGETLEQSSFSITTGPVGMDVYVMPDPVTVIDSGEVFSLNVELKNNGGGVVYKPDTASFVKGYKLTEDDYNIMDVEIILPKGKDANGNEVDLLKFMNDDDSCLNDIEMISGSASIICDLVVNEDVSVKRGYSMTIIANYGYYKDQETIVNVVGKD